MRASIAVCICILVTVVSVARLTECKPAPSNRERLDQAMQMLSDVKLNLRKEANKMVSVGSKKEVVQNSCHGATVEELLKGTNNFLRMRYRCIQSSDIKKFLRPFLMATLIPPYQGNNKKCILPQKEQVIEVLNCLDSFDRYGKLLIKADKSK